MTVTVDPISEARELLESRTSEARTQAHELGHHLHPWGPTPDGALAKRTACRTCGRPIRVQVVPAGTFSQAEVRVSGWLGLSVPCRK